MGAVREQCAECSRSGEAVPVNLVRHHITKPWQRDLEDKQFSFCDDPSCPVVYFTVDGEAFTVDDIRHPPAYKTGDSKHLLCFCFNVTGDDLSGRRDPMPYVRERVRREECACNVLNPSGACCLASIGRWKKAHS